MCKTNTGKRIAFLVAMLLAVAIFSSMAAPVEAAGTPTQLIVFTDKKVYKDFYLKQGRSDGFPSVSDDDDIDDLVLYSYAIVLDDDGNIMKGLSGITGILNDTQRLDHWDKGTDTTHHAINNSNPGYFNGNLFYNDTGASGDGISGDGIYTAFINLPDSTTTTAAQILDDHIRINISATYGSLTRYTEVLYSAQGCHNGETESHSTHTSNDVSPGSNGPSPCTMCHRGYEHFYESKSGTFPDPMLDVHFQKIQPNYTVQGGSQSISLVWNLSAAGTGAPAWGGNTADWEANMPGSSYCYICHYETAGGAPLDYGNGDRASPTWSDRPSCGVGSKTLNAVTGTVTCHATTEIEGTTVASWSQAAAAVSTTNTSLMNLWKSKSHNHTSPPNKANASCALCHGSVHQFKLPNSTATGSDYLDINVQCRTCHNITGGLNITANGGTNVAHDGKTNCKNCHVENSLLDTHLAPTGVFGGKWCMDCHNLTGKAPLNMKVDPAIANISNQNYTHFRLNKNSDAANSSRICWGCHTNNSYVNITSKSVNSTSLPASDHPAGFDSPKNCTLCHYNTSSFNFSAPQNYRHTWYAPDMKTPAVTSCNDCHAKEEMVLPWTESVYPPKNDSESASHYGKNRTSFFLPFVGTKQYCGYCHQNESTVMGPFANEDNEVRSDHASQITTPGCGNNTCHREGRLHNNSIVVPVFNESNINTTCLSCHSNTSYNAHNSTLTCWDCHMGNVSNTSSAWIHPIQFIQYNGNFTGAKLTSSTCYDCHKSTRVDNATLNLSGKKGPKVINQAHSNDPNNGSKWGNYWRYAHTTYEFAGYQIIGNGSINSSYPFDNIKVPSNAYMELIETRIGSGNGSTVPIDKKEQQINGPPVPNWTSSTATSGTTSAVTISTEQDSAKGNPAGSLKASMRTGSGSGDYLGYAWWNYSFYYKPNTTYGYAYTNASVNYNVTVPSGNTRVQKVYLRMVKPSGAIVNLSSNTSITGNTGWLNLSNNSFASAFTEDGSVTPYKLQLYTEFVGGKTSLTYTVNFDNILLKFQENVWNRYDIVINTTNVPVNGSSTRLGLSYQVHMENTSLQIYNKTSKAYDLLDTLDSGVFFDYVKTIDNTHHINSTNGVTGNVSVRFMDTDTGFTDSVSDKLHIRYLYVYVERGLQYPCEQCHSPNKHYVFPAIGSPDKFKAGNKYNTTDLKNSTWCQQCHWDKAANYSKMIQEFNITRNPPENVPPEITGNATYGNYTKYGGKSMDGTTAYVNHSGPAYSDMSDDGCFKCHGKSGDTTSSQFVHNVQIGTGGNRQCITCHNATTTQYKKIDVNALNRSMHAKLKNASANVSNASNPIELVCWACHGDGTYNNSDQHRNTNAWTCDRCHTNAIAGKLNYIAPMAYEHIPPNLASTSADINTTFNGSVWACADCHNNSINLTALIIDNDNDPISARAGHYGLNRTQGKLMYNYAVPPKGNSEDCNYCHKGNSANMTKWGVDTSSKKNLSNKVSPTDHTSFVNNDCGGCHNSNLTDNFTFHVVEINAGAGGAGGPNCISCHDNGGTAGAGKLVNFTAMNETSAIHKNLNSGAVTALPAVNKKCWACHDEGLEPSIHNQSRYKNPYNCTDCHTASGSKSGKYPGWNVTEHVKAGTVSGTEIFTPVANNCYVCHNVSEMMVGLNLDPDGPSVIIYGGVNGGSNSTSHYGLKRNLGSDDVYCNYCHRNSSSIFPFNNNHNTAIFEHTGNGSADVRNGTTLNCTDCHTTNPLSYRIHNSTLNTSLVSNWTGGKQDRCAPCHKATGSGSNLKVNNTYHNTTGNILDCGYCHNSDAMKSSAPQNIHSDNLTAGGNATYNNCYNCHQNGFASKVIFEHTNATGANITNSSMKCETSGCHNSSRTHSNSLVTPQASAWTSGKQDRCAPCHKTTGSGSSLKVNNTYHNTTTGSITDCGYCHNSDAMKSSAPQNIHSVNLTKGGNSTFNNCYNCHQNGFTNKTIFEHSNNTNANISNISMTCEKSGCHNNSRTHSRSLIKPAPTVWTAGGNDYCAPCHNSTDSMNNATKKVYNKGHDPANRTNDNITSCGNCHNASTLGAIPLSFRLHDSSSTNLSGSNDITCEGCHNGTTTYVGAGKQIFSHISNSSKYRGNTSTSNYSCKSCHNLTNKPSMHSAGMNRSNGTCDSCHYNNTSPFKSTAKNVTQLVGGMLNHSYNGTAKTNCTMCHNASGAARGFHIDQYAAGIIADPERVNGIWSTRDNYGFPANPYSPYVDCIDCHAVFNDTYPFNAPTYEPYELSRTGQNKKNHTSQDTMGQCYNCHTNMQDDTDRYMVHNVTIEPLEGGPACISCHNLSAPVASGYPSNRVNHTASDQSVHKNLTNFTAWDTSPHKAKTVLQDSACWTCHATDISNVPGNSHPDRGGPSSESPFQCEECHTEGGNISIYNYPVYLNATKVNKHYPGALVSGQMYFDTIAGCPICHRNSLLTSNISGYSQNIDVNNTNVSHYGTVTGLINTSFDLKGCNKCHGVGGQGQSAQAYGNAITLPASHNDMGASPVDCQEACHNSAVDAGGAHQAVKLHNDTVRIYIGTGICYTSGCHTPPPPPPPPIRR